MNDLVKLVNATIIRSNSTNTAYLINVELYDGEYMNAWFPVATIQLEKLPGGATKDIYVEEWFLDKKQDELAEEFVTEKTS